MGESRFKLLSAVSDWLKLLALVVLVAEVVILAAMQLTREGDPIRRWYPVLMLAFLALIAIGVIVDQILTHRASRTEAPAASDPADLEYMGLWDCRWTVEHPVERAGEPEIRDRVELRRARDGSVSGTGRAEDYGEYRITGTESRWGITLAYRGIDNRAELVGVVILEKSRVSDQLGGRWIQIPSKGGMLRGATAWSKVEV